MQLETAFSMDTSSIKYGPGVTREIGWDMEEQGSHRVMVVTDANLTESEPVAVTLESLRKHGIDAVLFDQVRAVKQPLFHLKRRLSSQRMENSTDSWRSAAAPAWIPPRPPTFI